MGSHSVTCHPTEMILTPLPRHVVSTHLLTLEGWKAELTHRWLVIPRRFTQRQSPIQVLTGPDVE